jgi:tetratricopeptide (TPR) repeat protein
MTADQVLDRIDERSASGSAAELPLLVAELEANDLTPDARLLLDILKEQARAHQGESAKALSALAALESTIAQSRNGRDAGTEEILQCALDSARGIAYCDQGEGKRALTCLRRALAIQQDRGDHWRESALHTNVAIAEMMSGDVRGSLKSLTAAAEALDRAAPRDRWRSTRFGTIEVNRAGALAALGDLEGAIGSYLRARPHLEIGDDRISIGALDLNLSEVYRRAGRFGSALESAESAYRAYQGADALVHARRARVAQAAALRRMQRLHDAEDIVVGECLPKSFDSLSGTELLTTIEAVDELAHVYRSTQRYSQARDLEHVSTLLSLRLPNPEIRALSIVMQYVFDAIDHSQPGRSFRLPNDLELAALQTIRNSPKHAEAPLIADLIERLMRAHGDGDYEDRALTDREVEAMSSMGWDIATWQSMINIAIGTRRRDDGRLLRGHLFDLARFHTLVAEQESPTVRGSMLASRGGLSLEMVVPLLLRSRDYAGLFEVIEWMRCDLGDSKIPSLPHDLVRFGQLLGLSEDASTTYALPAPVALSVRGRSILRDANPQVEVVAEADDIRRGLAGENSAWWTQMFFKGSLVWALLTPDGVYGGSSPLSKATEAALRSHFRALPLALAEDESIVGKDSAPWLRSVVAIARAAAGPLVQSRATLDECVAAAPEPVATRLREAIADSPDIFDEAYSALGAWMIPEELAEYLAKYPAEARLLISVQPETASVPSSLLRAPDGVQLIDRAVLLYAPPVRIARDLLRRRHDPGNARRHLLVRNPRGDLPASDQVVPDSWSLSGWATATSAEDVASRDALLRALQAEADAGPWAFSYFGHIVAGDLGNPASAALLLASNSPAGAGSRLSARELAEAGVRMPDRVYLGGCEGAGFGTSLEWSSIGAAALALGSDVVLAHRWPIIDGRHASVVDAKCAAVVAAGGDTAGQLRSLQQRWLQQWREGRPDAVPPHFWSGLQVIGRSLPAVTGEPPPA